MSTFLDQISNDSSKIKQKKLIGKNPFQSIILTKSDYSEIFGFKCDITFVEIKSLLKLKKIIPFHPLNELSPRYSNRIWFSICCVCKKKKDYLIVSDLHHIFFKVFGEFSSTIQIFDIIAISSCQISDVLTITDIKNILKIGHSNYIEKCLKFSKENKHCSKYIDNRNNTTCDFHCREMFLNAGKSRMLLKQSSMPYVTENIEVIDNTSILDQPPLNEIPNQYVSNYVETHPTGRGSKILQNEKKLLSPVLGKGYSKGDLIALM